MHLATPPLRAARSAPSLFLLAFALLVGSSLLAGSASAQAIDLPITFEEAINYELTDFGGAKESAVADDPADATNKVVKTVRPASAECFAGTTVAQTTGFANPVPFTATETTMSARVWSPEAGALVLFKVEDKDNPNVFVETYSYTTVAGGWETIAFDFADPKPNGAVINLSSTYNKASIFFDYQCDNVPATTLSAADRTYYWDDVAFGDAPAGGSTGATYTASLDSENEVPSISVSGDGTVTAALDGTSLVVSGSFDNLASDYNTNVGAHIHRGAAGTNGPVVVPLNPTLDTDNRGGTFETANNTFTIRETFADSIRAGLAYVNIHTVANPTGAIRGQLFPTVAINEFRVDQPGGDDDEYVELKGAAGTSLDGYTFLVIGDGSDGQGVIENVTSLDGQVIPDDGLFVFGELTLATADFVTNVNFENGQSSTLLLVDGFTGANGDDLDTDDDGTPDSAPWTSIIDAVGIVSGDADDIAYGQALGFTDVGPNGGFSPAQVFRDGRTGLYTIGQFGNFLFDTPGAANLATALTQIIHNAPDPQADSVDVYVNDVRLVDDLKFRTATPFVTLPAGVATTIDVTAGAATDNSAPVFSVTLNDGLDASEMYQVVAVGVLDDTPADDSDDTADEFTLLLADGARTMAADDVVAIRAVHGTPDAPTVDLRVRNPALVLFDDISYPSVSEDYAEVPPGIYTVDVTTADGATVVTSVRANLETGGTAVTVLASGFLDPTDDGDGAPGFGILAVFPDGTAALLPDGAPVSIGDGPESGGATLSVVNPIRNVATVRFATGVAGPATVAVFDVLGRQVALLADGDVDGEQQTATFDASRLASGSYVIRLQAGDVTVSRTVTVIR